MLNTYMSPCTRKFDCRRRHSNLQRLAPFNKNGCFYPYTCAISLLFHRIFFLFCKIGGSVVVYSLFVAAPIVCGGAVLGLCFVLQDFVSFLVLQSSCWGRES